MGKTARTNYFVTITPDCFAFINVDFDRLQIEIAKQTDTQHCVMLPHCKQSHHDIETFHLIYTAGTYDKYRKIYNLLSKCGFPDRTHIVMQNIKIETVVDEDLIELIKILCCQQWVCRVPRDDSRLPAVLKLWYKLGDEKAEVDVSSVLPCNYKFSVKEKMFRTLVQTTAEKDDTNTDETKSKDKSVEKRLKHLTDVETLMRTFNCHDYYSLWAKVKKDIMYSYYAKIGHCFNQFVTFVGHGLRAETVSLIKSTVRKHQKLHLINNLFLRFNFSTSARYNKCNLAARFCGRCLKSIPDQL